MAAGQQNLGAAERTFCPDCLRSLWQGGGRCKRRDCPGYAPIYLRDQAERLRQNLAAWDGKTCLVTLTAPGAYELPWDRSKCPPGEHVCSGKLGCRVGWMAAAGAVLPARLLAGDNPNIQAITNRLCKEVGRGNNAAKGLWGFLIIAESDSDLDLT